MDAEFALVHQHTDEGVQDGLLHRPALQARPGRVASRVPLCDNGVAVHYHDCCGGEVSSGKEPIQNCADPLVAGFNERLVLGLRNRHSRYGERRRMLVVPHDASSAGAVVRLRAEQTSHRCGDGLREGVYSVAQDGLKRTQLPHRQYGTAVSFVRIEFGYESGRA